MALAPRCNKASRFKVTLPAPSPGLHEEFVRAAREESECSSNEVLLSEAERISLCHRFDEWVLMVDGPLDLL